MTHFDHARDDLRVTTRLKSALRAKIIFNGKKSTLDCLVRNISTDGARLQVHAGHLAPDAFDLVVPHHNQTYRARAIWHGIDCMGVSFLDANADGTGDPGGDRIRDLTTENERLREHVRKLTRQLAEATWNS